MYLRTDTSVLIAEVTNQDAQYLLANFPGHWRPSRKDPSVSVFEFDQDMIWGKTDWRGEKVFTFYIWKGFTLWP